MSLKICCMSDLHGFLPAVPKDVDLLLLAGDLVPTWAHRPELGRTWLDTNFRKWLKPIVEQGVRVVSIAGNHDFWAERPSTRRVAERLPWIYLEDDWIVIDGLKFYGFPWTPHFDGWAFNLYEDEMEEKWEGVPLDVDVMVTHGPPYKVGDRTNEGLHVGCPSQRRWIEQVQPKLVACGHIHEGYGKYDLGRTLVVNAAQVDEDYELRNKPVVVEI